MALVQVCKASQLRLYLGTQHKLRGGHLHHGLSVLLHGAHRLFRTVVHDGLGCFFRGQILQRGVNDQLRIHIAHHTQHHIGGGVECLVAVEQILHSDLRDGFHGTCYRRADGGVLVQNFHQTDINLEVGAVVIHADFLSDDAALLFHGFLREVGRGYEVQQQL